MTPQTYASFWQRLGASLVDVAVFLPLTFIAYEGDSKVLLLLFSVFGTLVSTGYNIALHARFGQTVGKWLVGIRVIDKDGARIGWRQSALRSVIETLLGVLFTVQYAVQLAMVPDAKFYGVDDATRGANLLANDPYLYWIAPVVLLWTFSEVIVMLFNERRRSVHDFIAGTVVVEAERRAAVESHA